MPDAFTTQLLDMVQFTDYVATFGDPSRKIVDIDSWTYSIDGNALAANITQVVPQTFTTDMVGDCDFVLFYISGFARVTAEQTLRVNPAVLVQISDLTTGRTFFSAPAPLPMIAGQGGFPFLLTSPKVIKPRSTLQTRVISAQAVTFTGFYMALHGSRIWYG